MNPSDRYIGKYPSSGSIRDSTANAGPGSGTGPPNESHVAPEPYSNDLMKVAPAEVKVAVKSSVRKQFTQKENNENLEMEVLKLAN